MKRAHVVLFSLFILAFFLPGSAGANLIVNGGVEVGDVSGWNTWTKGETSSSLFELVDSAAFFGGGDTACRYDDLFTSTCAFASTANQYENLNWRVWDESRRDLLYQTRQYHTYFSVSDLWDDNPDARTGFSLLEACGLFCDQSENWVILDDVLAEANPAPVPEPTTILLIGSGLVSAGLISRMRRRKTKAS